MKTLNLEQYYLNQGGHYSKFEDWEKNLSEYERGAIEFLLKTGTSFSAVLAGHDKYFPDDKESRDIYQIKLEREGRPAFIFRFGQSLKDSALDVNGAPEESASLRKSGRNIAIKPEDFARKRKAPSAYCVLAAMTKYDPEDFANFCANFGYSEDSRKAEKIYFDVQKEYGEVCRLWNEKEREDLNEIN